MIEGIESPIELTQFQLPHAVQVRLQYVLECQDDGHLLSQAERQEAEGLVERAEFFFLLGLRPMRVIQQ